MLAILGQTEAREWLLFGFEGLWTNNNPNCHTDEPADGDRGGERIGRDLKAMVERDIPLFGFRDSREGNSNTKLSCLGENTVLGALFDCRIVRSCIGS